MELALVEEAFKDDQDRRDRSVEKTAIRRITDSGAEGLNNI